MLIKDARLTIISCLYVENVEELTTVSRNVRMGKIALNVLENTLSINATRALSSVNIVFHTTKSIIKTDQLVTWHGKSKNVKLSNLNIVILLNLQIILYYQLSQILYITKRRYANKQKKMIVARPI